MTLEQAKSLTHGQLIYLGIKHGKTSKGTPLAWRVVGKVRTWKRDPNRVYVPIKYGLYRHGKVDAVSLAWFFVDETEAKGDV